jgi:hypothetical protein
MFFPSESDRTGATIAGFYKYFSPVNEQMSSLATSCNATLV